ncbi:hypothetical protein MKC51_22150 [[Clostridium] innocuum]|nr:hypothetical protein [[Clostridium] innocuum]MCR0216434.1 hypothetical protein [[Clostridium] innocuum]MCR0398314.1 hypothetical protein [[Clostridium] innocuum]
MNEESNEVITLQINDKLRILNGDNDSFILQEAYISEKTNTLQWRNKSYYSDILTCLYAILRRMPIEQGDTIATYTERFEKLYQFLYIDFLGKVSLKAKKHGGKGAVKEGDEENEAE